MDLLFLLTIFPAYLVGSFFIKHDPGPTEPKQALHKGIWFGVLAVILALALSYGLDTFIDGSFAARTSGLQSNPSIPLFLDVLLFAAIEELVKFIPIAVFLLRKDFFNEHTDGIIYFAIVGLTFGGIESFLYGLGSGEYGTVVVVSRLVLGLFFHGALTAIVGYYFARAKVRGTGIGLSLMVLSGVSVVHAVYNYFVFSAIENTFYIAGAALVALAANITMFWLYYEATANDLKRGLAGIPDEAQQTTAQQNTAAQQQQFMQPNQTTYSEQQNPNQQ